MQIVIIGAGNVGRALGSGWSAIDHQIRYGVPASRSSKYADLGPDRVGAPRTLPATQRLSCWRRRGTLPRPR